MASEVPGQHGVDSHTGMAKIESAPTKADILHTGQESDGQVLNNVSLPGTEAGSRWNVHLAHGLIHTVTAHEPTASMPGFGDRQGALLGPSFCHPHIHIDKAYLLSHPKYAHLQIDKGDFQEAMDLTGEAKANFEHDDLMERGQRLVDESVAAGVTHMRAFVEVDAGVQLKCLNAGLELQRRAAKTGTCKIQICAFAQLALFSPSKGDEAGMVIRELMQAAASMTGVSAVGSTPYVETDREKMERNVDWMVALSIEHNLHLDFHLDYNMDSDTEPLVWYVVKALKDTSWKDRTSERTIVLGHCTRLMLFSAKEWELLASEISQAQLPLSFVGLPTSDLFMMRTGKQPEVRGTLDVPKLIKKHGLNACIGVNNIGNAFTPQGSCDPLSLACQGVGIYQAGTKQDTETLYECVSTRAKAAIGFGRKDVGNVGPAITCGDQADLVLFEATRNSWRTRRSVSEAVYLYDHCQPRSVISNGVRVESGWEK